jgi:hypothetical protein
VEDCHSNKDSKKIAQHNSIEYCWKERVRNRFVPRGQSEEWEGTSSQKNKAELPKQYGESVWQGVGSPDADTNKKGLPPSPDIPR